jgi:hypothetical protein
MAWQVKPTVALAIPGESLRSRLPTRAKRLVSDRQFGGTMLDALIFPYSPGKVVTKRALEKALTKVEGRDTALVVVGWDFTVEARAILDARQAVVLSDREFGWTDAMRTKIREVVPQPSTKQPSSPPAAFDGDSLAVAKDFLLKGLPWDLSRPHFIDNQREQIADKVRADSMFATKLRQVALEAVKSDAPSIVRRALTALAFVGTDTDLGTVEGLKAHGDAAVSKDAATCLYEIKRGIQKRPLGT